MQANQVENIHAIGTGWAVRERKGMLRAMQLAKLHPAAGLSSWEPM